VASDLRLKIVAGEGAGRELAIPEIGAVLGRDKEADIVLGEKVLSRRHCRIFRLERRWLVEDLGSRNGTFVNGSRTTRAELKAGDTIQLGHIRLTLLAPAVAPTSAEPSPPAAPSSVRKRRLPLIAGAAAAVVALGVIAYTVHALSLSSRAAELRQQLIALRKQAKAELGDGRYESAVKTYDQLLSLATPDTLADSEVRAIVEESRGAVETARRAIESRRRAAQPPGKGTERSAMPSSAVPSPAKDIDGQVLLPEEYEAEAEKAFAKGYTYFIWPAEKGIVNCQGKPGDFWRVLTVPFYFVADDYQGVPFDIAIEVILKERATGQPVFRQIGVSRGSAGPRGKGIAVCRTASPLGGTVERSLIEGNPIVNVYLVWKSEMEAHEIKPRHVISNSISVPVSF